MYYFNTGIPSAIIDDANGQAIEAFYDWQCSLNNNGYETVLMLVPEETITDGCTTSCGTGL